MEVILKVIIFFSRYFHKETATRSSTSIPEVELSVFEDPEKIAETDAASRCQEDEKVVTTTAEKEMEKNASEEAKKKKPRPRKNPLKTVTNTKTTQATLKQSLIYDETNIGKKSLKGTVKATIRYIVFF